MKYFMKLFNNSIVFEKVEHAEEFKRKRKEFSSPIYCLDGKRLQDVWTYESSGLPSISSSRPLFGQIVTWDSEKADDFEVQKKRIENKLKNLEYSFQEKEHLMELNRISKDKLETKKSKMCDLLQNVEKVISERQPPQSATSDSLLQLQTKIKNLLDSDTHFV
mmetsp:Transcript_35282/g.44964  ORF Transcript_35282/g.44964 Transcript_35282/m.44964 type:complete len:163 (-) Transcript_35282:188-676(-)